VHTDEMRGRPYSHQSNERNVILISIKREVGHTVSIQIILVDATSMPRLTDTNSLPILRGLSIEFQSHASAPSLCQSLNLIRPPHFPSLWPVFSKPPTILIHWILSQASFPKAAHTGSIPSERSGWTCNRTSIPCLHRLLVLSGTPHPCCPP
jgi:hypothetical protein